MLNGCFEIRSSGNYTDAFKGVRDSPPSHTIQTRKPADVDVRLPGVFFSVKNVVVSLVAGLVCPVFVPVCPIFGHGSLVDVILRQQIVIFSPPNADDHPHDYGDEPDDAGNDAHDYGYEAADYGDDAEDHDDEADEHHFGTHDHDHGPADYGHGAEDYLHEAEEYADAGGGAARLGGRADFPHPPCASGSQFDGFPGCEMKTASRDSSYRVKAWQHAQVTLLQLRSGVG